MANDWTSYDSAAATHQRLGVPTMFAMPARDLVARMDLRSARSILDVGTGSGIAALMAVQAAPNAIVTGLDPSVSMLRAARQSGVPRLVAGAVPGLPFPDASLDAVLSSFVLSHVPDCPGAIRDMVRVLRPGGKLGMTAWGTKRNEYRDFWQTLAESAVGKDRLATVTEKALMWEDWLTDPGNVRNALETAGLRSVEVHAAEYPVHMNIEQFLTLRGNSVHGRFMRTILDAGRWEQFQENATAEFHARFTDPIDHTRDALIATGVRS